MCKLAERMVLARISYALDTRHFFHPTQTGFHLNMRTQDNLVMLNDTLLSKRLNTSPQPQTLVALDLRKGFHSIEEDTTV